MNRAIINLLFPLLFIVSLGFLIYALVLFIRSFSIKSRSLRSKSLKIAILPLVYIIGSLSLFKVLAWKYSRNITPKLSGAYIYSLNDSKKVIYKLNSDNTFNVEGPDKKFAGTWEITPNTYLVTFYDSAHHELTRGAFEMTPVRKCLVFLNNKDTIRIIKQE